MVGREVKAGQKVGAKDGLTDVGDNEGEVEDAIGDAYLSVGEAIAGDFGTVCCMKFPRIWSRRFLLLSWGYDGPKGTTVD